MDRTPTSELVRYSLEYRERLQSDPHRPVYHLVSNEGPALPFDPNGALFWNGRYHLFYIFQDPRGFAERDGLRPEMDCWGHWSSADLIHWRQHPTGLTPGEADPESSIYSGAACVGLEGQAAMIYHGLPVGNCIATSTDPLLEHWTKLPTNPIVSCPQPGEAEFGVYDSWDPHIWVDGETYYAIFGSNPERGLKATLFRSQDLTQWRYLRPIPEFDLPGVRDDDDVSCPDLFPLGDRHVLMCISHKRGCRYYLGRWENESFVPEEHHWMNWPGGNFFAPESLLDDRGRRIMWAWVIDRRPRERMETAGWSGTMSLPRELSLASDGSMEIRPVSEMQTVRAAKLYTGRLETEEGASRLEGGNAIEIVATVDPRQARTVTVSVLQTPDGAEQTHIIVDLERNKLRVDVSSSSLDPDISYKHPDAGAVTEQIAPIRVDSGKPFELRIFVDHSIIEVFYNASQAMAQRVYPTRRDATGVSVGSEGGARFEVLDIWSIHPTNYW